MSDTKLPMSRQRRALLRAGLGLGMGLPLSWPGLARAGTGTGDKILVVLELSGGNDGLNTVVPYADDIYYRMRPNIGIKPNRVLKIDDRHGFNPGMKGFERLYKDGHLALVHGCGYELPSYSHFSQG